MLQFFSYICERLREQVEYWTKPENATEKTVEIVELFYDCG